MSSCCPAPEPVAVAAPSCCGTAQADDRAIVNTGLSVVDITAAVDGSQIRDPWPFLLPAWLKGTEDALPEAKPWHTVARNQAGEVAFLPGFVFDSPSLVDADPRVYLGWQPATGESACCGATSCCDGASQVDALGEEQFFPALVLGSPLGYRSEAPSTSADPLLVADLVDQLVPAALDAGIRTVVAPWIADRQENNALLISLRANGAGVAFWGEDHHFPIRHASYEAYLASLTSRKRNKFKGDHDRAAGSGVRIVRRDRDELLPHVDRIAELTGLNRQKYDGGEGPEHLRPLLRTLIEEGVDVRAYLGEKDGATVASVLTIRQGDRLFVKWAGFDYDAIGERSGLYFTLVLDAPVRDAHAEGLASVEFGPGAEEAKRLRGCSQRTIQSALLVADPALREQVAGWQAAFAEERRTALGVDQAPTKPAKRRFFGLRAAQEPGGSCCTPVEPAPKSGCCG